MQPIDLLLIAPSSPETQRLRELLATSSVERFQVQHVQEMEDALRRLAGTPPDVAILDSAVSGGNCLDHFRQLQNTAAGLPVIVLAGSDDMCGWRPIAARSGLPISMSSMGVRTSTRMADGSATSRSQASAGVISPAQGKGVMAVCGVDVVNSPRRALDRFRYTAKPDRRGRQE